MQAQGVHALCCEPVSQNADIHLSGKENLVELGIRVHKFADEVVGIDLGDEEVFGQQGPTHCILQSHTSQQKACQAGSFYRYVYHIILDNQDDRRTRNIV